MTRLATAAWPAVEAAAAAGGVLLVPVGATEQHGPHLPCTTDTDIAVAIAEATAAQVGRTVVAPALAFGSSGEHAGFAGTLSIGQEATEQVILELGRSAATVFDRTVLVCAHGGNAAPLRRALARLRMEGHPVEAFWPRWPGDLHAGRIETSVMLAIAPGCVDLERAAAGDRRPADELAPLLRAHGVRAVSANGVLGDPAGAHPNEGRALLAAAVDDLVARLDGPGDEHQEVG